MVGDRPLAKVARVVVLPAIHSPFPVQSHHRVRAVRVEAARPTWGIGAERHGQEEIQHRPLLRRILGPRGHGGKAGADGLGVVGAYRMRICRVRDVVALDAWRAGLVAPALQGAKAVAPLEDCPRAFWRNKRIRSHVLEQHGRCNAGGRVGDGADACLNAAIGCTGCLGHHGTVGALCGGEQRDNAAAAGSGNSAASAVHVRPHAGPICCGIGVRRTAQQHGEGGVVPPRGASSGLGPSDPPQSRPSGNSVKAPLAARRAHAGFCGSTVGRDEPSIKVPSGAKLIPEP
jgi:hypothetical protein